MDNTAKFNLNKTFTHFDDTIGSGVKSAVNTFFENNFKMMLVGINEFESLKDDPILKGELFYTCRISIKNKQHITLRVTSDFIRIIFHDLFGSNAPIFDLEKLTELEQKILNNLFELVVKNIEDFILKDTEQDKIDPLNKTELNFVFLIKNKDVNAGKLSVNIPLNRLKTKEIELVDNFIFEDFITNFAYVDLITGYAKISLNDLKNLDKDDILVLESSDVKTMTLKTETITKEIKVNPEPSIMLNMDDEENEDTEEYKEETMPENSNRSMWDDIQIEVSAEFKRVKMTLGELKQISKGLVIDLGAIMNNEISLLVENKAVAKGELVIINDKYGVKITEVFAAKRNEEQKPAPAQMAQPKPAPQAPHQAQAPQKPQAPQAPQRPQAQAPQAQAPNQAPAAPQRPQAPQRQMPPRPPQRPQAQAPQAQAPNQAPAAPQRPQAQASGQNKEDFDYSNFEE